MNFTQDMGILKDCNCKQTPKSHVYGPDSNYVLKM